jgi:CRP-like cAMP-binding protein
MAVNISRFGEKRNGLVPGSVMERSPLFAGILPAVYTELSASARVKEFARGEMLYVEGDLIQHVLMVAGGSAKITQVGMSGSEIILRLAVTGDVLGAVDLFAMGKHRTTVRAFRECRALAWDPAVFKALVERHPVLHRNMVRIVGADLLELEERFRELATERVGARVARQMVRLLGQLGRPVDGAMEIGLSREELAQMTGTTLFTVSRLLSAWEARGMVTARREAVTIRNVESLLAVSDES